MPSQPNPNNHANPTSRPLWQLLLDAQTDQLPPLTNYEYQALLELLNDLMTEGFDADSVLKRMAQYLTQVQEGQLQT